MTCPNGFYLKRSYNNNISNFSIVKAVDDICTKCHSTCKQCMGPGIDQCTVCFKLFQLDTISYNRDCIECIYNNNANPRNAVPDNCKRCIDQYHVQTIFLGASCAGCVKDRQFQDTMTGELC